MITIIGYRNAIYVEIDDSILELEVDTQEHGWIPISLDPLGSETEQHLVDIRAWAAANPQLISAYVAPDPIIPASVSMRQARLALNANGQLTTVQAALDGLAEPTRTASLIEWDYAKAVDRESVLTSQMAAVLGLDATALDALFTQAAAL